MLFWFKSISETDFCGPDFPLDKNFRSVRPFKS
jgi:hypothetical protein